MKIVYSLPISMLVILVVDSVGLGIVYPPVPLRGQLGVKTNLTSQMFGFMPNIMKFSFHFVKYLLLLFLLLLLLHKDSPFHLDTNQTDTNILQKMFRCLLFFFFFFFYLIKKCSLS